MTEQEDSYALQKKAYESLQKKLDAELGAGSILRSNSEEKLFKIYDSIWKPIVDKNTVEIKGTSEFKPMLMKAEPKDFAVKVERPPINTWDTPNTISMVRKMKKFLEKKNPMEEIKKGLAEDIKKLILIGIEHDDKRISRLTAVAEHSVNKVKDVEFHSVNVLPKNPHDPIPEIEVNYIWRGNIEKIFLNVDLKNDPDEGEKYWTLN